MAFSKTIQMYIFDGNPNGRIMCELSNWNGRVYKISRNELGAFSERPDAENTGVYFLLDKDEDNVDTLYVGEAEKKLTRLKQHLRDTLYWSSSVKQMDDQILFYIQAVRGADAKGGIVADGFAVLKGSAIATSTVQSMPESLIHLRSELMSKGIIDSKFHFSKDHIFTSPSLAAAIVMGRNANGRTEWKTSDHKTIKDIEEELLN